MSTTVRKKVTAQIVKDEHVDVDKKKQCLQTGIYDVTKRAPFLGSILQCLDMEYTHIVPRAGIMFDADGKKWKNDAIKSIKNYLTKELPNVTVLA